MMSVAASLLSGVAENDKLHSSSQDWANRYLVVAGATNHPLKILPEWSVVAVKFSAVGSMRSTSSKTVRFDS